MSKFNFSGERMRLRGYHEYSPTWRTIGSGDISIGMEMEVAGFRDRGSVINAIQELGFREDFMMATTDSSIGNSGIEWVTHPLGSEYLEEEGFDVLAEALAVFAAHGGKGEEAHVSCGCHHNFKTSKLTSPGAWAPAMDAVFKYYDTVFSKFNGPSRNSDNYARIPDSGDFMKFARSAGKYSFFNFRSNGVVEMRFPAMVMKPSKFRCQTRLCIAAVDFAVKGTTESVDAGDLTFLELFRPEDEDLAVLEEMGIHSRILKGQV